MGVQTVSDSNSDKPRSTKAKYGTKSGVRVPGGARACTGFQKLFGGYFLTDILASFSKAAKALRARQALTDRNRTKEEDRFSVLR